MCGGPRHDPFSEASEVARIPAKNGKIVEIDGVETFASRFELWPDEPEIVARFLLAGEEITANMPDIDRLRLDCRGPITLVAASRIRISIRAATPLRRSGNATRDRHEAELIDETSGQPLLADLRCVGR